MLELSADSVAEFIEHILQLRDRWSPAEPYAEHWFRGVNDARLPLLPGAYWRKECDEQSLVLSFRNMVPSYVSREPSDDWDWYYLMQHYGLPTRLLDWTENPLFALFFALRTVSTGAAPCVWVMDPVSLNKVTTGEDAENIIVPFGTTVTDTQFWLPERCCRGKKVHAFPADAAFTDNSKPLAIFPKRHNPRLVAQRGVFTIHGIDEVPIEALLIAAAVRGESKIAKVLIRADRRERILEDLWALGINQTALFPEPQSVAEDLKRIYHVP